MYCRNCGNTVKNGETFCAYCGTKIDNQVVYQNNNYSNQNINYNQSVQNTNYEYQNYGQASQNGYYQQQVQYVDIDEELLKSYIGEKYSSFVNNKFNVPMFFLGGVYLIYRKMWLYLLIVLAINFVLEFVPGFDGLSIIASAIYAIAVNKLYIKHAQQKVRKIKEKRPNMNFEQLKAECQRKGGTSIGWAIAVPSLIFIVIFAIMMVFMISQLFNQDYSDIKGYKWKANDNSVLYLYNDDTFIWYKDDFIYYDNYYTGKYEVYKGIAAINYMTNELPLYGVTAEEQMDLIYNQQIDNAMENYYVIVLDNEYLKIDGEEQVYSDDTYYFGFYNESKEYLDLVNVKTANYSGFTRIYPID